MTQLAHTAGVAFLTFRVCHAEDSYGGDSPPLEEWGIPCSINDEVDWDLVASELDAHGYDSLTPMEIASSKAWPLTTTVKVSPRKDGVGRHGSFFTFPTRKKIK